MVLVSRGNCAFADKARGVQYRWVSPTPYWPTDGAGRASEGLTRMDPTPPRIAKMGNAKATAVHFLLGLSWYFGVSPSQLEVLYRTLYPDTVR